MLISDKQQAANRENAKHSTGPVTPEGKAAVRLNALKYGLRARSAILPGEDPELYKQMWAELEAEWQPQTKCERLCLEQMATSQWFLARVGEGTLSVYEQDLPAKEQMSLLGSARAERTQLERSFFTGMRELKQLQKDRRAQAREQTRQPAQAAQTPAAPPVDSPVPPAPAYRMSHDLSGAAPDHPVLCFITPDTR